MAMIISHETMIKPSSPTPAHLKTYNLSVLDHFAPNIHMSSIFFYKNFNKDDINILKQSLSQCLTQYYPFAGRFLTPNAGHIECNDEGVAFLEAFHDSPIDDFIHQKVHDEKLYQLIPNGLGCIVGKSSHNFVEVQLTRFTGGGASLAISTSHKVTDGFTCVKFFNQWATVARGGELINTNFVCSTTNNDKMAEFGLNNTSTEVKYVTRRFVFPNSKLNDLKKKVISIGIDLTDPTRVEVLTSLIFKCSVDAVTTKSGVFKSSNLLHTVNMRNKIIKNDPENAAGNICTEVTVNMVDSDEIRLNEVVAKLRKGKMELEGLKDVQQVAKDMENRLAMLGGSPNQEAFMSSSLCGFPFYEVDFGWGKPVKVAVMFPNVENKGIFLADTPNRDGIEAIVHLPEEEMVIFQENKELLAYVDA